MLDYMNLCRMAQLARERSISLGALVLADQAEQMETTEEKILEMMDWQLTVM